MRAVRGLVVHQLFAAWRGWVALALLAGLAAGVVLAAVAGARRTDSAYPRFLAASKAADALVSPADSGSVGYYSALSRLPEVSAVAPVAGLQALPAGPDGRPESGATVFAPADGRFARVLGVPTLLAGRLPLPDRPGEVAVSQIGAQALHLHVGSRLAMAAFAANAPPTGPHFRRQRASSWRHPHPRFGHSRHRARQGSPHHGEQRPVARPRREICGLRGRVRQTPAGRRRCRPQPPGTIARAGISCDGASGLCRGRKDTGRHYRARYPPGSHHVGAVRAGGRDHRTARRRPGRLAAAVRRLRGPPGAGGPGDDPPPVDGRGTGQGGRCRDGRNGARRRGGGRRVAAHAYRARAPGRAQPGRERRRACPAHRFRGDCRAAASAGRPAGVASRVGRLSG